jgi:putative ABC transport system permease protein
MIILRFALRELFHHFRLVFFMVLAVGIPLMSFFTLEAYHAGLIARYSGDDRNFLVAQLSGSFGEIVGSRMPAQVGVDLRSAGASMAIPEIHAIVGSSSENAVMLRGIPLESYARVENYKLVAGRSLQEGDPPRLAMIGSRLAGSNKLISGDNIQIRGRDFKIIGVFEAGTYAGNEAWISIQDAQALLGWGTDVSTYLIPDGEIFKEGDTLPGGISIVKKGASSAALLAEWQPVFNLLAIVTSTLGVAAAVGLASILWRLAWLQRRELAILRSVGFGKGSTAVYLFLQGGAISLLGFIVAGLGSAAIGSFTEFNASGVSINAVMNGSVILSSLVFAACITLSGSFVPAWWFNRLNLAELLKSK